MHALGLFIAELSQHSHPPAVRRLVERIAASAGAMENLLDSLLDISRLDADVVQPDARPFALQPLLDRIAASERRGADAHGLQLKARPTDAWIESDPVLFERILGNLVGNALAHTPPGGCGTRPWRAPARRLLFMHEERPTPIPLLEIHQCFDSPSCSWSSP